MREMASKWHVPRGDEKRWSPSRTGVTVMCITTQRRNQPYAG